MVTSHKSSIARLQQSLLAGRLVMTKMSRSTLAFLSISFFALQLNAQTTAVASVDGIVSDSTSRVIFNAQVTMTETDKGLVRTGTTDTEGRYAFPNLPVGPYRLEVKAPGFKDHIQSGLVLQVGNNIQMNVAMQVGSVSERVEINTAA